MSATQTGVSTTFADNSWAQLSLGITTNSINTLKPAQQVQTAQDASLSVNGVQNITSATNTVTTAIPGITLNINGSDAGASTTTLNVSANTLLAQTNIQAFVTQYNSTMSLINTALNGGSTTDSTTGITTNQPGVLEGDATLEGIQQQLRTMVSGSTFNNPTGPYQTLSSIGITTSSANFGEDPTLTFDTTQFAAAMVANPNSVANLFGAAAGGVTPSTSTSNAQGLANILENYLQPMVMYGGSLSTTEAGYTSQLTDLQTQITNFETKATAYEAAQNLKFANLETLLAGLNSQNSALTSAINGLPSYSTK